SLLEGHYQKTLERMAQYERVYIVSDTMSANFNSHAATTGLGSIGKRGPTKGHTLGLLVHTSMAYSPAGTPLGIVNQKIWSRKHLKKENEADILLMESEGNKWLLPLRKLLKRENAKGTQIIEIGDREIDCNSFISEAHAHGDLYVIRAKEQ